MVRVSSRFIHVEDRRNTSIRAFEQGTPLIARLGLEMLREFALERRPFTAVHLLFEQRIGASGAPQ